MHDHRTHLKLLGAATAVLLVLAAFGVPVLSYLPFIAIVAICPLMMMLMMKGMDHGGRSDSLEDSDENRPATHRH